jgi:hypothetical protein
VYALNLNHSPEKGEFWVWAEPVHQGAGHAGGAEMTSAECPPGVSDSIELHNGLQVTRQATSNDSWGKAQCKYSSMVSNVKRGVQMVASRVMRTGTPQWLAMKRGNARRVKVLTFDRPLQRKHGHYARSE